MSIEPFGLHTEAQGPYAGITTLLLQQQDKPVVVLDHDLLRRIERTIPLVPRSARGFVLASAAPRAFIAGADLRTIQDWDDEQLHRYLEYGSMVFSLVGQLPCPTVAAINGAALGGGLELAMHCDGLVAAPPPMRDGQPGKPYPVGLPEAGLSICPGWGGTNLLPARLDPALAIELTASGRTMLFDEACARGVFDRVAPSAEALLATARDWLVEQGSAPRRDGAPSRWIGRVSVAARVLSGLDACRAGLPSTGSARAVAECVDVGLAHGWKQALACERAHLVRLRSEPAGKSAIAAFFAKK